MKSRLSRLYALSSRPIGTGREADVVDPPTGRYKAMPIPFVPGCRSSACHPPHAAPSIAK
jgi:CRISPR/Cas system CMR subunit Cmr4 (Cas7 group RAMP superfamily)